jgi:DNA-binding HxlR family transcriptional regulator
MYRSDDAPDMVDESDEESSGADGRGHDDPVYDPPARVAADEVLTDLFELLGRPHTAAIVRRFACDPGPWRYSELQTTLEISPTTLSRRLSALTEAGLVERRQYDEIPPRMEYTLTEKGAGLRPGIEALLRWVEEFGDADGDATSDPDGDGVEG